MAHITRVLRIYLVFAVAASLTSDPAVAQSGRAYMEGMVIGHRELLGLEGATVELVGDPDDPYVRGVTMSTTTDREGRYEMREIRHGPYTLTVSLRGYTTYRIPIYLLTDSQTKLHVRLEAARQPGRRSRRRAGG
jgi:hypothetical protein